MSRVFASYTITLFAVFATGIFEMRCQIAKMNRHLLNAIILFIICGLLSPSHVLSANDNWTLQNGIDDPTPYFRTPANNAINCLYLQLCVLGYKEDYWQFQKRATQLPQPLSLLSMARLAGQLGFNLEAVKMSFADLAKMRIPVIVHLEPRELDIGWFYLCVGMDTDQTSIMVIEGSYVVRQWMPRDQFRRAWSGYALVPRPATIWWLWVRRAAAVLLLIVCGLWLLRCKVGLESTPGRGYRMARESK